MKEILDKVVMVDSDSYNLWARKKVFNFNKVPKTYTK